MRSLSGTHKHALLGIALVVITIVKSGQLMAAQDDVRFNAALGGLYDSNRELQSSQPEEVKGSITRAGFRYKHATENTSLETAFRFLDEYFPDYRELENDSLGLFLTVKQNWEKSRLNTDMTLLSDTSLATDVQVDGFVRERKDRLKGAFSSNYEFSLTEADLLLAGLSAETVDYSDIIPGQLAEYDYYGLNLGYGKALRDTSSIQLFVYANQLRNNSSQYRNDVEGLKIDWIEQLSETQELDVSIGKRRAVYRQDAEIVAFQDGKYQLVPYEIEQTERGILYRIEWTYKGETLRTDLSGSLDLVPNSAGDLVDRKEVALKNYVKLTTKTGFGINLRFWEQTSELESQTGDDTRGYQANFSFNWQWHRNLYLISRLQRLDRELIARSESAHSNRFTIEISWLEDPWFL